MKRVPFTVTGGEPLKVEVVANDGKRYQLLISVGLLSVVDSDQPNPQDPTLPLFQIQATLVCETKPEPQ